MQINIFFHSQFIQLCNDQLFVRVSFYLFLVLFSCRERNDVSKSICKPNVRDHSQYSLLLLFMASDFTLIKPWIHFYIILNVVLVVQFYSFASCYPVFFFPESFIEDFFLFPCTLLAPLLLISCYTVLINNIFIFSSPLHIFQSHFLFFVNFILCLSFHKQGKM